VPPHDSARKTRVQLDAEDQADNLRTYGGCVPGIEPGPSAPGYFDHVVGRHEGLKN
jgi:preprotein translocase subunit SecY